MKEEHLKRHNDAVGRFNNKKLKCLNCGKDILYKKRRNKFCNHSCAASFNNIGKRRHGEQPNNCLICGKKLLNSK